MYEPVKTFYMGSSPGEAPFLTKVTLLMVQQIVNTGRDEMGHHPTDCKAYEAPACDRWRLD